MSACVFGRDKVFKDGIKLDVWEHAYYLKYYIKRAYYVSDWSKVVNWEKGNDGYMKCVKAG